MKNCLDCNEVVVNGPPFCFRCYTKRELRFWEESFLVVLTKTDNTGIAGNIASSALKVWRDRVDFCR